MSDGAPPPEEPGPPVEDRNDIGATAGLGSRFGARLIDGLIVGVGVAILVFVLPGIEPRDPLGNALSSVVYLTYFVCLEGTTGVTPGKRLLNLRVVPEAGTLSFERAFRRNWWGGLGILGAVPLAILGVLALLASLVAVISIAITIARDDRDQGWHDDLASTLVVRTA